MTTHCYIRELLISLLSLAAFSTCPAPTDDLQCGTSVPRKHGEKKGESNSRVRHGQKVSEVGKVEIEPITTADWERADGPYECVEENGDMSDDEHDGQDDEDLGDTLLVPGMEGILKILAWLWRQVSSRLIRFQTMIEFNVIGIQWRRMEY